MVKTLSVKLPEGIVTSARVVSALSGEPIQDLLTRLLGPQLEELECRLLQQRAEQKLPGPPPKGPAETSRKAGDDTRRETKHVR